MPRDIFIPEIGAFFYKALHQRNANGIVQKDDIDGVRSQKVDVTREVSTFADHNLPNSKLHLPERIMQGLSVV